MKGESGDGGKVKEGEREGLCKGVKESVSKIRHISIWNDSLTFDHDTFQAQSPDRVL